jgi:hypothetical protein
MISRRGVSLKGRNASVAFLGRGKRIESEPEPSSPSEVRAADAGTSITEAGNNLRSYGGESLSHA